jgi:hypothetical protein
VAKEKATQLDVVHEDFSQQFNARRASDLQEGANQTAICGIPSGTLATSRALALRDLAQSQEQHGQVTLLLHF